MAGNLFPEEYAAIFSRVYDNGGDDASTLATAVRCVEVTPPQAVFTRFEFEAFYKLSKFLIYTNSITYLRCHHEVLVKIFDICSELVNMIQRNKGTNARIVRVTAAGNTA
jgi:hypothetical protein